MVFGFGNAAAGLSQGLSSDRLSSPAAMPSATRCAHPRGRGQHVGQERLRGKKEERTPTCMAVSWYFSRRGGPSSSPSAPASSASHSFSSTTSSLASTWGGRGELYAYVCVCVCRVDAWCQSGAVASLGSAGSAQGCSIGCLPGSRRQRMEPPPCPPTLQQTKGPAPTPYRHPKQRAQGVRTSPICCSMRSSSPASSSLLRSRWPSMSRSWGAGVEGWGG